MADRITGTGEFEHVQTRRGYEPEPGKHLWIAVVTYGLSDQEVASAFKSGEPLRMGAERIVIGPDVGCLVCEEPFRPELLGSRCPGEPKR